jgi:hypothetical protein
MIMQNTELYILLEEVLHIINNQGGYGERTGALVSGKLHCQLEPMASAKAKIRHVFGETFLGQ